MTAPHVYCRGPTFWFRRRIPRALIQIFGKSCAAFSLRTNIESEAVRLAARLRVVTDGVFDTLRQIMNQ